MAPRWRFRLRTKIPSYLKENSGVRLEEDLIKELKELEFDRNGESALKESLKGTDFWSYWVSDYPSYEIPDYLEEMFTLRIERFQVFVVSGIQEDFNDKPISFVTVTLPYMGWELERFLRDNITKDQLLVQLVEETEETYEDALFEILGEIQDLSEMSYPTRLYYPVLAEYVDDPFENEEEFQKRKDILGLIITLLCTKFGFKVFFSESGDIPKEFHDDWLDPTLLQEYNNHLAKINSELEKTPDNPQLCFEKAGLLLSRDRADEALDWLEKAQELDGDKPHIWYAISDAYYKLGRIKDAKAAEKKADSIKKLKDTPTSKANIFDFVSPFSKQFDELYETNENAPDDQVRCSSCGYDFLYIKDDIWYNCNRCNAINFIEGAAIGIYIKLAKDQININDNNVIWLDVELENKTRFNMKFSTEDTEIHLVKADIEINEISKKGRASKYKLDNSNFGPLPITSKTTLLEPHQKLNFRFNLRKIDWQDEYLRQFDIPGSYILDLWIHVKIQTDWGEMKSWTTSEPGFLIIEN